MVEHTFGILTLEIRNIIPDAAFVRADCWGVLAIEKKATGLDLLRLSGPKRCAGNSRAYNGVVFASVALTTTLFMTNIVFPLGVRF